MPILNGDALMDMKLHWERVYEGKSSTEVSWFQQEARISLDLITQGGRTSDAVIDVGGGASTLVDGLLLRGYADITVLDIAAAALDAARTRLGNLRDRVKWVKGDVLGHTFSPQSFDIWHDRAVFHFLTSAADRRTYINQVAHAVRAGGMVVVATFAEDGPSKCSGLDVFRYSPEALHTESGSPNLEQRCSRTM
jgi:ubiquinone/menaquinone biosynthesis C-methylase UbiE